MKLMNVLNTLDEMGLFRNTYKIVIAVTTGMSLKKEDIMFEYTFPVEEAKHFFGETEVIANKLVNVGDYHIPMFYFLVSYEKE